MIPSLGTHDSRQRTNNKPIRVGYMFWVLAETNGYVIQFEPYQVAKVGQSVVSQTRWGLGEKVALDLMECLPQGVSYHVYIFNLNQIVNGAKLKEITFKSTNQTSFISTTEIWILQIEWIKTELAKYRMGIRMKEMVVSSFCLNG